jgi:quinol-cytochrome oxidoreductase complex cytochrome b subunit
MNNSDRKPTAIERFLLHIHPSKVDEQAIIFTRTFGLGGIGALLFILLTISGLLLRFTYVPTPEGAFNSIIFLQEKVLFGQLLRNIHRLSATLMVVVTFLHLIRTYYSQSIYFERSKNWIYGLILMFLVLFSNFTGYLLPWDQLAYWAVTIMTNMLEYIPFVGDLLANMFRGGEVVDGVTLINFYNLHTGVLPLFMVFCMAMHFWLVRKAKGVVVPKTEERNLVSVYPNLVLKEIMVALIVIASIFILSISIDAPLLDKASTSVSPNPSKAPWYFMGVQELLLHMHPTFAVFVIPVAMLVMFFYLPYFKYTNLNIGVWFNSKNGKSLCIKSIIFSFAFTVIIVLVSEYWLNFSVWFPRLPLLISTGLFPLLLFLVPTAGYLYYWYKIKNTDKIEIFISIVTIIVVAYIVMMLIGVWFRGEGMNLIF